MAARDPRFHYPHARPSSVEIVFPRDLNLDEQNLIEQSLENLLSTDFRCILNQERPDVPAIKILTEEETQHYFLDLYALCNLFFLRQELKHLAQEIPDIEFDVFITKNGNSIKYEAQAGELIRAKCNSARGPELHYSGGSEKRIYTVKRSSRQGKKWMVITPSGKSVHFGAEGYEDYTMHHDDSRLAAYISRHHTRENWTPSGLSTAGFWSRWLLWNKDTIEASAKDIEQRFGIQVIVKK